jgi:predicted RNase H-like HicB family nuclease
MQVTTSNHDVPLSCESAHDTESAERGRRTIRPSPDRATTAGCPRCRSTSQPGTAPATNPSVRAFHTMAYDAAAGKVVRVTQGKSLNEAKEVAASALETALDFSFENSRVVPTPSRIKRGQDFVESGEPQQSNIQPIGYVYY